MPEKFGLQVVTRVYLRTTRVQYLLRQPHPAQQVGVAGIGAEVVKIRQGFNEEQARMFLISPF
jgi:hypothetical protein